MDDVFALMRNARRERHAQIIKHLKSPLYRISPPPSKLRELASHVNVDNIREINDPDVLIKWFTELESELLTWADRLEEFYATKR